ncbi:hypothetical protein AMATHDRAFT_72813 [Amanita thiersii Skay4041]|uniref:Adenylate kinase active site lid domain-containing protein n=1 Tax=Amanita thiersii Skay4041 TaxID=703135 RepID=A0A2A9P102_9AGAR|nr:hypothetical protein AMATHDRAFT_72813 [Amanita thiersii Skay4041]
MHSALARRVMPSQLLAVATQVTRRCFSHTASRSRALPFFLTARTRNGNETENDQTGRRMLRMLMFGKPGAGKGTLTGRLVRKYDIVSVSTGDLLRQHIAEKTEVGREAEDIVAAGGLLPDEVMLRVVSSELESLHNKHWILDGFPRTIGQAELLDGHLKKRSMSSLTLVVNLDVPDDVILSRISDRFVHLPSGRVYNLSYNPPRVAGFDDLTGEPLTKRPDDNPDVFARRLAKFYSTTAPLLNHYSSSASRAAPPRNPHLHPHQLSFPQSALPTLKVKTLSGTTSDQIWPQLDGLIRNGFPSLRERVDTIQMNLNNKRRHSLSEASITLNSEQK